MVSFPDIQMLSLHCNKQPLPFPQLSFGTNKRLVSLWLGHHDEGNGFKKTSKNQSSSSWIVHAVDKDSKQYEIDPDKAKDALKKLDQQLQSLSKKQVSPPKIKASDVKLTRRRDDEAMEEEVPEFSGSVMAYTTIALFLFTIFYNVLFYAVIKPSIDGPESEPTTATMEKEESPEAAVLQLLPSMPDNILPKL